MDPLLILYLCVPFFMVTFGFLSNMCIIKVFVSKHLRNTLSRNLLCFLAVNDMISIVSVIPYSLDAYGIKVMERNQFSCRFWTFLSYFMPANTSWLLVFISIDRLYGIRNQTRRYTFSFQLVIVVLILIFCHLLLLYALL